MPMNPPRSTPMLRPAWLPVCVLVAALLAVPVRADSVNSPNITLNVDTNRTGGPGAGGVAVTINTVTIAETTLPEYSSGSDRRITIQARPGFHFDPASNVTAQSATIGLNGGAVNAVATVTPQGTANEIITFSLTSGTSTSVQDIIRINGIKVRIISAAGAAGPAQTTFALTTSTAGGAFTNQGIVAANITKGAPDRLVFSAEPGSTQSGGDILPAVKIVDFGGNLLNNETRTISLALQANPGAATLLGTLERSTTAGVATWFDADDLRILTAAAGYTLRASHSGAPFLSSDTVDSNPFEITAGAPDHLVITQQPVDTAAGEAILLTVEVRDLAENTVTTSTDPITLDSAINPGGWPLLVDTSLTKPAVAGVATWNATDNLRINQAIADYSLSASGVGAPVQTTAFDITAAAPALLRIIQQPTTVQEDLSIDPAVTVEIEDIFGNRVNSTATVDLVLQSACGGIISGGAATAVAGLATFDAVKIDTPCTNVQLEAASGALLRDISDSFTVTPLPPAALRFVQQPSAVEEGQAINPPVSVEIVDATGKRTDSNATVQLTLVSSCGGTLSATSAAAVGGLATFAILSIDTACPSVALQATSGTLTGTTSDTFNVTEPVVIVEEDPAACGACGTGASLAMLPTTLLLLGLKRRRSLRRP
ncbi:MAG: hypothetical protein IT450_17630 [Phycisphaerales bacterium]|nr:hypothetical protein [Phycisphaerales bacterium]